MSAIIALLSVTVFAFLGMIWTTDTGANTIIKFVMWVMFVVNAISFLELMGWLRPVT